jgi:GNAT superfamily N-acetyltransferase
MIDLYARDPMGQGKPLENAISERIPSLVSDHPTGGALLAEMDGHVVGVAAFFMGYSTFRGGWMFNLHDLCVDPAVRGLGVGRALLEGCKSHARKVGCVRMALEVSEGNPARSLYEAAGLRQASLYYTVDL